MSTTTTTTHHPNYTEIDFLPPTLSTLAESFCENQTQSPLDKLDDRINVVVPYLVILGIIGNGLSVLTFSQRKLRILSCGCYLLLLAISDTIGLLIMSRPYFFKQFNLVHHLNSSFLCGLHLFLTKIFDELTPWLLVLVACNRLVLSRYPRNDQSFQTARAALWSALCLLSIIILINSHLLFGIGVGFSPLQPCISVCGPLTKSPYYLFFYKNVSPIIDLCLSLIIPFCLIFIANIFLLANVSNVKKKVIRVRRRKRASRNARLSIVLLADLITFLIVSLPVLSVDCIYRFTRTIDHNEKLDEYISIAWTIVNKIFYLNYSLSFYFYVLSSSYFRHHFLLAIRCKKLHSILFNPATKTRPATNFIMKYHKNHSPPSPPKIVVKQYDCEVMCSEQPQNINNCHSELIPLHQSHTTLTTLSGDAMHVEIKLK
ncbi:unnamed protein product [Adineta steineri]|uniref:G-protein coupled receptors family 1 profile domain-containing protein n=1 Tax=Adineta steineri TaxID=433720 RepID=A0A813P464_9BILA|nr:unnamed protein product [Adineta steineri]CAF3489336.1 unnamed protein product [Adineta steineri]